MQQQQQNWFVFILNKQNNSLLRKISIAKQAEGAALGVWADNEMQGGISGHSAVPHQGSAGSHSWVSNNWADKSQSPRLLHLAITGNHKFHSLIK